MNKIKELILEKKLLTGIFIFLVGILNCNKVHAWTAAVAAPPTINGSHTGADYLINFSSTDVNGNNPFTRQVVFSQITSSADLKGRCVAMIQSYLAIDGGLPNTNFVIDISTQPLTPVSQVQIDALQWISDYRNFKSLQSLFDLGVFSSTGNPVLATQKDNFESNVRSNFKLGYLQFIIP